MKAALVLCPQWDTSCPVYSLALLSALLKSQGHEPAIFDLNIEMFALSACSRDGEFAPMVNTLSTWVDSQYVEDRVIPAYQDFFDSAVERILASGSRVVGFSVYYSNAVLSLYLARRLKRRDPGVFIVFGGPNCLSFEGCLGFLAHDAVDAAIFGEADLSFPKLVTSLEKKGRPEAGPGILLREARSTWIESREPIEDLDALPFADYEGHRLALYSKIKTVHSCRGCVRRCVFCVDWREMSYRQMSGDRIYREFAHQLEKTPDIRRFLFGDSIINGSMKSISTFCDKMIGGSVDAEWFGFAIVRPELDLAFLTKMRDAGCGALTFGVESGSAAVLRNIGKNVDSSLNARVLGDAVRAGIRTQATWLVGYPTETDESFEESMVFLRDHAKSIKELSPSLFSIQEMKDSGARLGFTTDHDLYWRGCGGRNTYPVRVERLRRIIKEAAVLGIGASFEGKFGAATIDGCCEALLESHDRWKSDPKNRVAA